MHELLKLKEMLCDELKEYGEKGDLTAGTLDVVDKLSHAIKNLDKIIEAYDDGEYSGRMMPRYYYDEGRGYADGRSYNRNERSYARRDSRGRSSRDGIADKLRELMNDAPDERAREEIRKLADKMSAM